MTLTTSQRLTLFTALLLLALPGQAAVAANPAPALDDPQASPEARRVYDYVCNMRGKAILSGQQEVPHSSAADSDEILYVERITGKRPAILGLDYIDYENVNARAITWWKAGGIPSICWHWGAPTKGQGFKASQLSISIEDALTPGTALNQALLADLDRTAAELAVLRDAHVPVLWRPLHELDGGWFWWGKCGPEAFKRLWILMHERYTKVHHLDNLIWVFGYTSKPAAAWYPGNEYVDIMGADNYKEGTQEAMYKALGPIAQPGTVLAYHECGAMPEPEELLAAKVEWSWFLTWHTKHVMKENTPEKLRRIYNHPYVVNLDSLPSFTGAKK